MGDYTDLLTTASHLRSFTHCSRGLQGWEDFDTAGGDDENPFAPAEDFFHASGMSNKLLATCNAKCCVGTRVYKAVESLTHRKR